MVIAIEDKDTDLTEFLENKGHAVVSLYDYHRPVDAVVISRTHLYDLPLTAENFTDSSGVFVVYTEGLTNEEIASRLEQKSSDGLSLF
ncbi:MAG: hypothetical protein E7418_00430 [Ruminococcaceae bacterium]|nr:hypothetical protein [Oscillospiraceae bacterium]